MNTINLPHHLLIPSFISLLILGIIIYNRKRVLKVKKWRWFWISSFLFFAIYMIIVGGAAYYDIAVQIQLNSFDLNRDGAFSGEEITVAQKEAMFKVTRDTARNFAVISGLIFSGIIAFFIFIIGVFTEYLIGKNKNNRQQGI